MNGIKILNNYRIVHFIRFIMRRFEEAEIVQVAGSLTFTTLLALVPLLVVMLSVVAAFPMFNDWLNAFTSFINRMIVPSGASVVADYLASFKAKTGQLTAVGIVGMVMTSLLLLQTMEQTFNRIWRVEQQRSWWIRFPMYWLLLTIGPLAAGFSLSVSAYMHIEQGWFLVKMNLLWQILYDTLFLSILYRLLPNCRVMTHHALLGALITSCGLEVAKWGFGVYIANFNSYTLIYGAFAVIPVFLVWLHLLWMIMLSGALLTACIAYWRSDLLVQSTRYTVSWRDVMMTLSHLAQAQQQGKVLSFNDLLSYVYEPQKVLCTLENWGYVAQSRTGWLLKSTPEQISLAPIFRQLIGEDRILQNELAQLECLRLQDYMQQQTDP